MSETIPNGWRKVKLGDVCKLLRGQGISKDQVTKTGKYKCVLYGELYTKYKEIIYNVKSRTDSEEGTKSKKGDILIPGSTTTTGIDLANAVALNEEGVMLGGDINILRKKDDSYNCEFLAYYLTHIKKGDIMRLTQGVTIIHLYGKHLQEIELILPPRELQNKLAEIIKTTDKAIDETDKIITKSVKIMRGIIENIICKGIGYKEFVESEIGEIPNKWVVKKLNQITEKIGDGLHATPNYVEESEFFFINGNNLMEGNIKITASTKCINKEEFNKYYINLNEKTILLSINGTIGNIAFYNNDKVILGKSVAYINCVSNLDKRFIALVLNSRRVQKYFQRELTGTTIRNLSLKTIRNTKMSLPTDKEKEEIVKIADSLNERIVTEKRKKLQLLKTKKGLMQKLLTGKILVKVD